MPMQRNAIFTISITCVAVVAVVFFYYPHDRPVTAIDATGTLDIAAERQFWQERVATTGAARAYGEFKAAYADADFDRQHIAAHLWGNLLFDTTGLDGVGICDSTFKFGCYHGFFTAAIGNRDIGILPELERACRAKFGSLASACEHGIGHGILEYLGHDNLAGALEACAAMPQTDPVAGCTAGVFMEYNLPLTVVPGAAAFMRYRPLDDANPYEPCPNLPQQFRQSCYHELLQLWDRNYNYGKIGILCAALSNGAERKACFQGAGTAAMLSSRYDVASTVGKCRELPADGQTICRIAASWGFTGAEPYRHLAHQLCQGLGADIEAQCAPQISAP